MLIRLSRSQEEALLRKASEHSRAESDAVMGLAKAKQTEGAKMQATVYDMDEIQEALARMVEASPQSAGELADEMRVDKSTVYRWASGARQPMRALQPVLYGILRDRGYLDGDRN